MKKLTVKKDAECMACLECVRACSTAFYKEFHPDYSCIKIVAKPGGAKPTTCIQCGKCMRTCEHEAITQNPKTGVYMINKKKCVGCGKCEKHCPQQIHIREELKNVKRRMENPAHKVAKVVADKIYKY